MTTQQILIIDDDPAMGQSVRELLSHYGYEAEYASEGTVGLSRLTEEEFDVLILDLNIPDMSGIEVLTQLKALKKRVKTIVLSGESEVQVVTPVLRLGAHDYLSKPYQPDQLLGAVRNALSQLQLERENEKLQNERDITRKRHEFLLNASSDLIYLLDEGGNFTFVNNQLEQVFGYRQNQLLGKSWRELLSVEKANLLEHHFNERRSGERSTQELAFDYISADGDKHCIELSAMGVYALKESESAGFEGTYGILRDVTRARELAQEQEKTEADRAAIESQLQQSAKMEAIGRLAGGIAHDFNNILATIIGYTELAIDARQAEKAEKYLAEVMQASKQARDLISQMLSFSRTSKWNAKQLDVEDTLAQVSGMLRAAIPSNILLHSHIATDLPHIFIDANQLQQVVVNLIINASGAIEGTGNIRLHAHRDNMSTRCASCSEYFSGAYLTLSVSDTGDQIPAELHQNIFCSLVSSSKPGRTNGFGLWQVHHILHEYGGHVSVQNMPGEGAQFSIHLPAITKAQKTATNMLPGSSTIEVEGKILVVDEEVSLSKLIGELLSNAGYDVVLINSSVEALDFIARNHEYLSLIITDQAMPKISGIQLANQSKSIAPTVPIVIMAGIEDGQTSQLLAQASIEAVLNKPFNVDDLTNIVRELAHRKLTETG
ncbi:MAG: response regulator [Pseudomonadales bacterium]|nr:response regulator [Pseudomonadales bacterium]